MMSGGSQHVYYPRREIDESCNFDYWKIRWTRYGSEPEAAIGAVARLPAGIIYASFYAEQIILSSFIYLLVQQCGIYHQYNSKYSDKQALQTEVTQLADSSWPATPPIIQHNLEVAKHCCKCNCHIDGTLSRNQNPEDNLKGLAPMLCVSMILLSPLLWGCFLNKSSYTVGMQQYKWYSRFVPTTVCAKNLVTGKTMSIGLNGLLIAAHCQYQYRLFVWRYSVLFSDYETEDLQLREVSYRYYSPYGKRNFICNISSTSFVAIRDFFLTHLLYHCYLLFILSLFLPAMAQIYTNDCAEIFNSTSQSLDHWDLPLVFQKKASLTAFGQTHR